MVMAFGVVSSIIVACSDSSKADAEAEAQRIEAATADSIRMVAMADSIAELEAAAESASNVPTFTWSSEFDEWVQNGTEAKTITLEGLGDEESGITAAGQAQLDYIATVLEAHDDVKAVIRGHTDSDQKIGNGRGRAIWTKAKLILGHDAVGSRISTEGVGTSQPIEGVDLADDSQKRVTVSFTKSMIYGRQPF